MRYKSDYKKKIDKKDNKNFRLNNSYSSKPKIITTYQL